MFGVKVKDDYISIDSLDAGDWLRYQLNLPAAGSYLMELRVSSPSGEGSFVVGNSESRKKYARIDHIPATGNTTHWEAIRRTVDLPLGEVTLEIRSLQAGWNLKNFSLKPLDPLDSRYRNEFVQTESVERITPAAVPLNNTSMQLPVTPTIPSFLTIIAADDFVNMQGIQLQTSSEGLDNIGWIDPSDYVTYNVSLPFLGTYDLRTRISSPYGQGGFQIVNNETQQIYATISNFPTTGDWQIWQTISNSIQLPAGSISLRFVSLQEGWNLLWFSLELVEIVESSSSRPSLTPTTTPTTSLASLAPSTAPTKIPTKRPTQAPSPRPTPSPTTITPWAHPTRAPVGTPTWSPRVAPTRAPNVVVAPVITTRNWYSHSNPKPTTWH